MRRFLPIGVGFAIALVAFVAAWGVNQGFALLIAPSGPVAAPVVASTEAGGPRSSPLARSRALSEKDYIDAILRRNIFDPGYIDTWHPAAAGGGSQLPVSDLKLRLLATIVAKPEAYSSALIADEGANEAVGYGVGDTILGTASVVVGIEQKRVKLRDPDGTISYLSVDDEGAPVVVDGGAPAGEGTNEFGIEQISENKFAIPKDVLEKYLSDMEGMSRMGRALLHRGPDGEFDGYRLSAIRRGSIADALGIKNGDVVQTVNGQPLNSVQSAMNAYQTMSGSSAFSFEVTRRGEKVTLEYEVR